MSRSSSVNAGEMAAGKTLATGQAVVQSDTILLQTDRRIELVDLTEILTELIRATGIREGIASLWSLHTTCGLFINEAQPALQSDIIRVLESMVDRDAEWRHNDPEHSDCDRMNADSHLRAMLLGHSVTLQVSGGVPVLGQWQRILAGEMDGPRARSIRVQVIGIA